MEEGEPACQETLLQLPQQVKTLTIIVIMTIRTMFLTMMIMMTNMMMMNMMMKTMMMVALMRMTMMMVIAKMMMTMMVMTIVTDNNGQDTMIRNQTLWSGVVLSRQYSVSILPSNQYILTSSHFHFPIFIGSGKKQ